MNTTICFDGNGKFTNKNDKNPTVINGKYAVSHDGKTLTQSMEQQDGEIDNDPQFVRVELSAEIVSIDEKKLVFKLETGMMYFDRK